MTEKLLKKQNANLASAKANLQRELDDTAGQLRQLQSRLAQRETALSVLDRHWAQLELRLGAAKPRLAAGGDASSSAALPRQTLLESLDSLPPGNGSPRFGLGLGARVGQASLAVRSRASPIFLNPPSFS